MPQVQGVELARASLGDDPVAHVSSAADEAEAQANTDTTALRQDTLPVYCMDERAPNGRQGETSCRR